MTQVSNLKEMIFIYTLSGEDLTLFVNILDLIRQKLHCKLIKARGVATTGRNPLISLLINRNLNIKVSD